MISVNNIQDIGGDMFGRLSLRARILLGVVSVVTLGFAITIFFVVRQGTLIQTESAYAYVEERVQNEAIKIAQETGAAASTAHVMAQMFKGMRDSGKADRDIALAIMQEILSDNPQFLGVWAIWEPNAVDGYDEFYRSKPYHDESGRFIPYVYRSGDEVNIEAIRDYTDRSVSDYYFLAYDRGEAVLLEPYSYVVEDGSTVSMTSVAVPIKHEGRILGVTGVDIELSSLQEWVSQIVEYGIGYARLISTENNYIGHRDADRVGQAVHTDNVNLLSTLNAGKVDGFVEQDRLLNEKSYTAVAPIQIGSLNERWALSLTVPLSLVLEQVKTIRNVSVVLGLLSIIIVSLVLGWILNRLVIRPIGGEPAHASYVVSRIAEGDLTSSIHLNERDKGSLLYAMKVMQAQLVGIITSIRANSDSVSEASHQLAKANIDLSQRTEEQAAALQETAASLEELSATVSQNSEYTQRANNRAVEATELALNGDRAVGDIVESMTQLTQSSQEMGDIIAVIEGIAFQTNILALNAAVEAARAGEHGRGFAVVASEVRTLAQRSASAAQEVKELIEGSVEVATNSTAKVDNASKAIQQVVAAINDLSVITNEIATASLEQSDGLSQIHTAVTQMDSVTQQNAAMVEEAAAATASLEEQAQQVSNTVAVFKI